MAPPPSFSISSFLRFQADLAEQAPDLVFETVQQHPQQLRLQRQNLPLQIVLTAKAGAPIAQVTILAQSPQREAAVFVQDAVLVIESIRRVWPQPLQIVRRDCTIRYLYSVREQHAFQFLWEKRLNRDQGDLGKLGRRVAGGGLRLVMPEPTGNDPATPGLEAKVESLLADPRYLFVELTCVWQQSSTETALDPQGMISWAEQYREEHLEPFIGEYQS